MVTSEQGLDGPGGRETPLGQVFVPAADLLCRERSRWVADTATWPVRVRQDDGVVDVVYTGGQYP